MHDTVIYFASLALAGLTCAVAWSMGQQLVDSLVARLERK